MDATAAERRLDELFQGLANYERTKVVAREWSLDTTRELLAGVGAAGSYRGRRVQVAGSKGKGTTVGYLESMARAAGLRTGTFTSPHLQRVTERVALDGVPVDPQHLLQAVERVLAVAGERGLQPSFFEAITVAAVLLFDAAAVDLGIFEVGLGGRLDATTAVPVDGTVVTRIELEHTAILGDTLAAVAGEKAGAIRPGRPVWVLSPGAGDEPVVEAVLRDHAARVGGLWSPVAPAVDTGEDPGSWRGELPVGGGRVPVRIDGGSRFERPALALAAACLRGLFPDRRFALDPVARPELPARFEVIPGDWPLVLDGAHTGASAAAVAAELRRRFGDRPVAVLFASGADKRWQEVLRAFLQMADKFYVTGLRGTPGVSPGVVAEWLRQQGSIASEVAGPAEGLAALRGCEAIRLVVGSFYLAGAVRSLLQES